MINCRIRSIQRRLSLVLLAASLVVRIASQGVQAGDSTNRPPAPRRPSILLIVADDLGYGDLGCYGQKQIKTPHIDQLAAQGMRFTSFYAGSATGLPSRAVLLTGLHTGHARIRGNSSVCLQAEDLTAAQLLKSANYATGAIGVWGLGNEGSPGMPRRQGFDEWFGYLDENEADNYYPKFLNRSEGEKVKEQPIDENRGGGQGRYADDYFTFAGTNFLRISRPAFFNHYRPFFLYLPYTIARANHKLGAETGNGMEVPEDAPYSAEQWPQVEKNKAAMITRLDRYVGMLQDRLKELKCLDNTIIIITSANGPHNEGGVNPKFFHSAGPLRGIKRDLYEGGIRVPLIVSWPARIRPGSVSDLPCASWDFLATAVEIAGQPAPTKTDGVSLFPTLTGQTQTNRHEFLYWESHEDGFKQAARMGDWKALRFGVDGPLELYNLKTDLGETANLADKNPEVIARISEYLKTARTEDANWPVKTAAESPRKEYGK